MKTESKIKVLAELDGWILTPANDSWKQNFWLEPITKILRTQHELPPYLTSYDAVIPLVQKQPQSVKINMAIIIWKAKCINHQDDWTNDDIVEIAFGGTMEEIADALIHATGKWQEE